MSSLLTFLLIITLCVLLLSKPSLSVFVSIDCGSSESFTDINDIRWSGDDGYIQNGESRQVYSRSNPVTIGTPRVFPTGKSNCYTIKVPEGEQILARATFHYGNYDKKLSPPIFDLMFEGNYWTTVNTSMTTSLYFIEYEVIYVTKRNFTSICVVQTKPNQLPFITSLEIRSLDPTMYSHVDSDYALVLQSRYAYGANETIRIRYPDDIYDRIWTPAVGFLLDEVKSEVSSIDTSTAEDLPPKAALQNAVVSSNNEVYIQFINRLPSKELPIYINTYFSEITESAFGKRSIQMYIDNIPFSSPIIPPLGSVKEVYIITDIRTSSNTQFFLRASDTSTLPPILNAIEVYTISDALNVGTDTGIGDKPKSSVKQALSPPPPSELISGDEPNSPIKQTLPLPPPPFFSGDELNNSPPLSEIDPSMLIMVATQTLLSLVILKFI